MDGRKKTLWNSISCFLFMAIYNQLTKLPFPVKAAFGLYPSKCQIYANVTYKYVRIKFSLILISDIILETRGNQAVDEAGNYPKSSRFPV
jgi:hypothetical protein